MWTPSTSLRNNYGRFRFFLQFLSLDDIKEHKNLDINEDGELTLVTLIQRVPIALLPLADSEKGHHPLLR